MKAKHSRDNLVFDGYPKEYCHKCGKRYWDNTVVSKTWGCLYCGNLIYFNYGAFKQQIDLIMESSRGDDFVRSPDGKTIIPKSNAQIKSINFSKKLEGKDAK